MSLGRAIGQGLRNVAGAYQQNRQIKAIENRQASMNLRSENSLQATQLRHDIAKMRHDEAVMKMANQRSQIEKELKQKQKEEFIKRMKQGKLRAAELRARQQKAE